MPDTPDPTTLRVITFSDDNSSDELPPQTDSLEPEVADLEESDQGTTAAASVRSRRVSLVGQFGSMNRREAANVLRSYQADVVELPRKKGRPASSDSDTTENANRSDTKTDRGVDWIVIGADQPPLSMNEILAPEWIAAAATGDVEILHETELWQKLGLIDEERSINNLYTPAMLADLLDVSVRVIRRWHRRGLIAPVSTLHKLPYFDYAEVATAKRLAGWLAAGASSQAIERRLVELIHVLPNIRRPLDQLSILIEGKHVLLRQGDGLVEPGGQMRFDFDALEEDPHGNSANNFDQQDASTNSKRDIVAFEPPDQPPMLRAVAAPEGDTILESAYRAEDDDDLQTAIDLYHTVLARDGARADICFQIGELLYRMNHLVAARERYYAAIELDPDFVEARASLGAVLAELGQNELAIAALRGALTMYNDYADVHYTLAKTLDKIGDEEALEHWSKIIDLAPESPWAAEAKLRLGIEEGEPS